MASVRGRGSWWRKPAGCRSQEQDLGALPGRGHCAPCPVVPSQPRLAREAAAASHRRWISCTLPGETATSEASVPLPHRRPGPCGLCAVPAAPEPWQSDSLTPSQGPGGTSPLGAHRPHRSWDTAAFLILGLLPNEGSGCALCTVDGVDPHAHGVRSGPVGGEGATRLPPRVWAAAAPSLPSGTSTGRPHRGGDGPRGVDECRLPERQETEACVCIKWHENVSRLQIAPLCGAACGSVRVSGLFSWLWENAIGILIGLHGACRWLWGVWTLPQYKFVQSTNVEHRVCFCIFFSFFRCL